MDKYHLGNHKLTTILAAGQTILHLYVGGSLCFSELLHSAAKILCCTFSNGMVMNWKEHERSKRGLIKHWPIGS
jgi:hypothetical protein